MKKTQPLTIGAALLIGGLGGATINDIGAKDTDQWVTVQKICPDETERVLRGLLAADACPEIYKSHGAECNLNEDLAEVRYDWFKDGDSRSCRMHVRFLLPGTFKAE